MHETGRAGDPHGAADRSPDVEVAPFDHVEPAEKKDVARRRPLQQARAVGLRERCDLAGRGRAEVMLERPVEGVAGDREAARGEDRVRGEGIVVGDGASAARAALDRRARDASAGADPSGTVTFGGQVIVGDMVSLTVMVWLQVETLLQLSTTI